MKKKKREKKVMDQKGRLVKTCEKIVCLFFLRLYLFIHERHGQREKQAPCGGPEDYDLSCRQIFND